MNEYLRPIFVIFPLLACIAFFIQSFDVKDGTFAIASGIMFCAFVYLLKTIINDHR